MSVPRGLTQAAGADPAVFMGLTPAVYTVFTVVGVLIGAIGLGLMHIAAVAVPVYRRFLPLSR